MISNTYNWMITNEIIIKIIVTILSYSTLHIVLDDPSLQFYDRRPYDRVEHVVMLDLDLVQFYLNVNFAQKRTKISSI